MKLCLGVSLLVLLCFSVTSRGQAPTAVVDAQVRDASGAAIACGTLEFLNDATHVQYSTETNDEGTYSVPNLPPGTYHIQVSKQGFKTVIHADITLNVQDAKAISFTFPVGSVSHTVTVEGGAPLVNTEPAAVSTVVDQSYVKNMPLNGRSFQDLISAHAGTVTRSPQNSRNSVLGMTGEFSVNGQRQESNIYTVDGVSANVGASPGLGMVQGAGASGSVRASTAARTRNIRSQAPTPLAHNSHIPACIYLIAAKRGTSRF